MIKSIFLIDEKMTKISGNDDQARGIWSLFSLLDYTIVSIYMWTKHAYYFRIWLVSD